MAEPLRIHIDPRALTVTDFDQLLMSKYDMFYRRIVEYVLKDIEEGSKDEIMAILVDEDGVEYDVDADQTISVNEREPLHGANRLVR